nr:hypothetical protein BaRGS_027468 [Batillaria attramentaria]
MEAPIMIGAHPQGLEVPGAGLGPAAGGERNSQWTIRTKGLPVDMTEEGFVMTKGVKAIPEEHMENTRL